MSPFRPSREQRGPDPYLQWKMALFAAGAAAGVAGMLTDNAWILGFGIALLAAGLLLRSLRQYREAEDEDEDHPPRR